MRDLFMIIVSIIAIATLSLTVNSQRRSGSGTPTRTPLQPCSQLSGENLLIKTRSCTSNGKTTTVGIWENERFGTTFDGTDVLRDPNKPQSGFGGTTFEGTDISRTNAPSTQLPKPCNTVTKGKGKAPANTRGQAQRPCDNGPTANPSGSVASGAGQAATSPPANAPKAVGTVRQPTPVVTKTRRAVRPKPKH